MTESDQSRSFCHQSRGYRSVHEFEYSPLTDLPFKGTIRNVFYPNEPCDSYRIYRGTPAVHSKSNTNLNTCICLSFMYLYFLPRRNSPPSGPRYLHYRGFMITLRHSAVVRTPLYGWSARRRDLYLTTHNRRPCFWWDSNPQSQLASCRRPTP